MGVDDVFAPVPLLTAEVGTLWKTRQNSVLQALPEAATPPPHDLQPGDLIWVKQHTRRHCLQPRWRGPYQVLLTIATAVKCEGLTSWTHSSHTKKATAQDNLEQASPMPPVVPEHPRWYNLRSTKTADHRTALKKRQIPATHSRPGLELHPSKDTCFCVFQDVPAFIMC